MKRERLWIKKLPSRELLYTFILEGGFTPLISQILINKGFQEVSSAYRFLFPQLTDLGSPFEIPGMLEAVKRLSVSLERGEALGIYGDSDVDGIVGSYILYDFLKKITGIPPLVIIPDKNKEGYGFHSKFLPIFKERGVKLIITVDVGISAVETVNTAKMLGMEVIITDHHEIRQKPETYIVSGKLTPTDSPFHYLCGAGVALALIRGLRSYLYQRGFFKEMKPPSLREYLELVALATLADMVPLVGENRIITYFGFRDLSEPSHPLLKELIQSLNLKLPLSEEDLHFKIIPRLNACGRLGKGELLFNLLAKDDQAVEGEAVKILEDIYGERQLLEGEIWEKIDRETNSMAHHRVILGVFEGIPRAMLGLLANRLKRKYERPVLLVSLENGLAYGSGRSPEGIDLLDLLWPYRELFLELGGHKKAFGFQILSENLKTLEKILRDLPLEDSTQEPALYVEAETTVAELLLEENLSIIREFPPYGIGHEPPLLALKGFQVKSCEYLKEKHTKFLLRDGAKELYALYFNQICPESIHLLAGYPYINNYSQRLEIKVEDVKL